jgi:peptide chain release factor 2
LAAEPSFWDKQERAQEVLRQTAQLKAAVEAQDKQRKALEDARVLCELAAEASDLDSLREADAAARTEEQTLDKREFARMLSGEQDRAAAIVQLNAGAGGTDAQDWCEMLLRMYTRFCERKGWKAELLDAQPGEEAGLKSATLSVDGEFAYGYLRAENGVHRLVRISPFDANARRQTAFSSVFVTPDIQEDIKIDIEEKDLRIDTYRAGGAGGQHVNKTDSAVRITHLPTGIVVQCQNERSQHKNKSQAMRVLRSRLYEMKLREKEAKLGDLNAQKKSIEWGSQIRSYVLAPYRMVSDHRTDLKVGNVDAVLDGDLEDFIRTYLMAGAPAAKEAPKD